MATVSVNPPKTPVTKGSNGIAAATVPNICKMPGPPAPFVPTPLPNIGKSGNSPDGYSKNVKFEGKEIAIKGATFKSMGDVASKGTGGGMVSANTEGPTKFVGPGSMDVKVEGKNVQLLSDPMLNNCGAGGSPANAATLMGILQATGLTAVSGKDKCPICGSTQHKDFKENDDTKKDAHSLSEALHGIIMRNRNRTTCSTMLGVVHCTGNKKYAAMSGVIKTEFVAAADRHGMLHPPSSGVSFFEGKEPSNQDVQDKLKAMLKGVNKELLFIKKWDMAKQANRRSRVTGGTTAYTPGACAAQKALVHLLNQGCTPAAMTERYYNSGGKETDAPIRYIDENGKEQYKKFASGKTVPPCKTCTILLPLLLCRDEEAKC